MLSTRICAIYPDLAKLSYLQQLMEFVARQERKARQEWVDWLEQGSMGPEPDFSLSAPLSRIAHKERFRVWSRVWAKKSRRLGWGKVAAEWEATNFAFCLNDGLQQKQDRIEEMLKRNKL